jgi:hypothetical protein
LPSENLHEKTSKFAFNSRTENIGIARKPAWCGQPAKKKPFSKKGSDYLAEREGFEPSIQV